MLLCKRKPGDEIVDYYFDIDTDLFRLGVKVRNLLALEIYLTLLPGARFFSAPRATWRQAKQDFDNNFEGWTAMCEIKENETQNARFALFFGFEKALVAHGRALYVRKV